jgi:hypothetical protein
VVANPATSVAMLQTQANSDTASTFNHRVDVCMGHTHGAVRY